MRTAAWEAASQVALRDCPKAAVGEGQYIKFWWRGVQYHEALNLQKVFVSPEGMMSLWRDLVLPQIWGDARIKMVKSVPKNICLKSCPTRFPGAQSALLHLNSLRDCWKSAATAAGGSISLEADGKCLCCSVLGNALGKCQFVVDIYYSSDYCQYIVPNHLWISHGYLFSYQFNLGKFS